MRRGIYLSAFLLLMLALLPPPARAADEVDGAAVRFHCAGMQSLEGDAGPATLHKILAAPSVAAYRKFILTRFEAMLAGDFGFGTNNAALMEPMVNDALDKESAGELNATSSGSFNFIVAAAANETRARVWRDNLDKGFGHAGEKFSVEGFDGWRWQGADSRTVWMIPAKGWLLAGRGDGFDVLQARYLQQIKSQGRPVASLNDHWLEARVDSSKLGSGGPEWAEWFKAAQWDIAGSTQKDNLQLTAKMTHPSAVSWTPEPWRIPTNLVKNPLTSFTVGRGAASFLNLDPALAALPASPLTNQFCVWAMKGLPFLSFMTWPENDPTNAWTALAKDAVPAFNPVLKAFNGTALITNATAKRLVLSNLRVAAPSLGPAEGAAGGFLAVSIYPPPPRTEPAPPSLWREVFGRPNLVYYDWELTGARLEQWRMLGRMLLTRARTPTAYVMRPRNLASRWMSDLEPLLGNTVTEITRTAPNELSLVRTGPVGLTGVELYLLSDWLSTVGAPPVSARPATP